jgi:alpha-L-rhamnosidase
MLLILSLLAAAAQLSHAQRPGPAPPNAADVAVEALKVNSLVEPISIDVPRPHFSWKINGCGARGVVADAYEIVLRSGGGGSAELWASGKVSSNRTTYIELGAAAANLTSDKQYLWAVRSYIAGAAKPTAWANASFSTALLEQTDWAGSEWITSPGGDALGGQYTSQMRKVFSLDAAPARGRLYLALPGYGEVWLNGARVDDASTGSRTLSQFDYRMLYQTYDCTLLLKPGKNVLAITVGLGWWGHPAVPPQATRFPFGPPTVRALLRVGAKVVVTDASWQQTQGPIIYDDEYNGETYDARLETPGWTTSTDPMYTTALGATTTGKSPAVWTAVELAASAANFTLGHTIMSSAAFQPIKAITRLPAQWMRSPAPGVYVYDFVQNKPGWCRLSLTCEAGLVVQLRHAEVLQHPPYGPEDGNVYVGNLRSAKATDIYICKGDQAGEAVEFSFTQHGYAMEL